MKLFKNEFTFVLAILVLGSIGEIATRKGKGGDKGKNTDSSIGWKKELDSKVKLYGHRNWIVIADDAYPMQSNPAIETIVIDGSQLEIIEYISNLVEKDTHIDATIFVDKELAFVAEENAKGITAYRNSLNKLLEGKPVKKMLHEDIMKELDASAKLFNVLIIKTDLAIPYTSVFFQLECGYWNQGSEYELREALKAE